MDKLDKYPRVIVRINMNTVGSGVGKSEVENGVQEMIREWFEPLKNLTTGEKESPVYVVLDGLNEVFPQNQDSELNVFWLLLSGREILKKDKWNMGQIQFVVNVLGTNK